MKWAGWRAEQLCARAGLWFIVAETMWAVEARVSRWGARANRRATRRLHEYKLRLSLSRGSGTSPLSPESVSPRAVLEADTPVKDGKANLGGTASPLPCEGSGGGAGC